MYGIVVCVCARVHVRLMCMERGEEVVGARGEGEGGGLGRLLTATTTNSYHEPQHNTT
jgi:hypothetical protein